MIIQDKSRKCLKEEQEILSIALLLESYSDNKFWTAFFSTQKKKLTVTSFKYLGAIISNEGPKTGDSLQE